MIKFSVLLIGALLIGITKAGFGGGAGLIVGPMLMLVFPAKESLGMMLPLLFACDVVSLFFYWRKWDKLNIIFIVPGAVVGIGIGSIFLGRFDDRILAKMIGITAIGFALLQILRHQLMRRNKQFKTQLWQGISVGAATGFFSTVAHLGGVLTMMFLLVQQLENQVFVATAALIYFSINLFKIPVYLKLNVMNTKILLRILPFLPLIAVGTMLGVYLNRRTSAKMFSRIILTIVFLTGIRLILK